VTRAVVATIALVVALCGCAVRTRAPAQLSGASPARVDVARILAAAPFATVLAQYDADLAALRRSVDDPAFANARTQINDATAGIRGRISAGSQRLRGLHVQPVALPTDAGVQPVRNFSGAVEPFARAALARVERAVALRAAAMREREATIAYDYERAHAGQRLVVQLKLRELHLDAVARRRYATVLASLDRQEAALVAAARARDDAELTIYRAQLRARAVADAGAMASDVAAHDRAARALAQSSVRTPATWLPRWTDDGARNAAILDDAGNDLTNRFGALRRADDSGMTAVRDEIAGLQRQRDALRAQIVASVMARAARIAAQAHFGRVYTNGAPSGAHDLTAEVMRSYSVSTGS